MVYVGCAHALCTAGGSGFGSDELPSFQDAGAHQYMLWLYYMGLLGNRC